MSAGRSEQYLPMANGGTGWGRRLSDKVLVAFHAACDNDDLAVAEALFGALDVLLKRIPTGQERRRGEIDLLVAAINRYWHLRNSADTK